MRRQMWFVAAICVAMSSAAFAGMVHQDWDTSVSGSRQAIIDFLEDLVNPTTPPDLEEVIDESFYVGSKDNYVAKFYGWLTVPETGTYQFHYSSDDHGMLYVSQDEEMANAVEVAYVEGWAAPGEWNKFPDTQHSEPMELRKGQVMAVMAFFREGGGGDNMDIGWTGPGLSDDITNPTYLTDYITHLAPPPAQARRPVPEAEAVDVPYDTDLSWSSGVFAATHDVYFGDNFDDVNAATRTDPRGVLVSEGQTVESFDLGILEFGMTYYWRIDEVNAPPTNTVYKGKIWEFTVEPFTYAIEGVIASSNAASDAASGPEKTVDGSGLNAEGQHSTDAEDMWLGVPAGADPVYLMYEFDLIYKLHEMVVWNYNEEFELMLGFGLKSVSVEYSVDGENWTVLGDVELNQATARSEYTANSTVSFGGVAAKFVKLTVNSNQGFLPQYGLSEVKFMQIPAHPRQPEPADGAADANVLTALTWRSGRDAVSHDVSLGTDPEALEPVGTVDVPSLVPAALDLETTYYWQVTEVNEADAVPAWVGSVWSFTTQASRVVDDFEGYNDDIDAGGTIFQTWVDGYQIDENGATVGNLEAPFAERTVIRAGKQSMIMTYDNSGASYSEATANVADLPISQDWTKGAPTALVLWVRGALDNAAADQLYVKINGTKVVFADGVSVPIWKQWTIDLAGINVSNVTSLTIGVEGNGAGVLYVDEIALYRIAPAAAEPGDDPSLVAHWKLDETEGLVAADSSGYGNDGTLIGMEGTEWTTGMLGGGLEFSGGQYVDCGNGPSVQLSGSVTISAWVKMSPNNADAYMGIGGRLKTAPYRGFSLVRHSSNVFRLWADNGGGDIAGFDASSDTTYTDTEWHHIAGVVDGGTSSLYVDGVMQAKQGAVNLQDSGEFAHIGRQYSGLDDRYWNGIIDDFRIYYRALSAQEIADM